MQHAFKLHLHFVHNLFAFLFWNTKKDDVLKNISSFFVNTNLKILTWENESHTCLE